MKKSKSKQRPKKPGKPAHSAAARKDFRQARNLEEAVREFEAGNYPAALQLLQQIVIAEPKNLQALWYCGLIAYRLGDLDKAVVIVQECVSVQPDFVDGYNMLGILHHHRRDFQAAIQSFQTAIRIRPDFAEAYNNLGGVFYDQGLKERAREYFVRAVTLKPDYPMAHYNLGKADKDLHRFDQARQSYEKALSCAPSFVYAWRNLGIVLHDLGLFDQAKECYEKVIGLQPDFAPAYLTLAKMRKFSGDEELIGAIEAEITRPGLTDPQRMFLSFARAKIYEDTREYSRAFACLTEANKLKRKSFFYSSSESEQLFESIKGSFAHCPVSAGTTKKGGKVPIFILGMPRSGTSLVEQILASHPAVYGAGELNNFQAFLLDTSRTGSLAAAMARLAGDPDGLGRELGSRYLASLELFPGKARYITDKMPNNFLLIGAIRLSLPAAKIIHCTREPLDNCLSIYKNYFAGNLPYAYDLGELGRYYLLYRDLMRFWGQRFPDAVHTIKYESLLQDQEKETRNLLKFCGLPWDEGCLSYHRTQRPVATASAAQVRKPLYRDSVALWKVYKKELEPLRAILGGDSSIF